MNRTALSRLLLSTSALAGAACLSGVAWAQEAPPSGDRAASDVSELSEVVVTGTNIRGIKPVGAEVIAIGRDEIKKTGATTVQDILSQIPQTTQFNSLPSGLPDAGAVTQVPNLRGVGLGGTATLTLVDGRRMVGSGFLQTIPEPSQIPAVAVERVEVIPDGSSAIYGSDAVTGVINLVTRRNFNGAETAIQGGGADGFSRFNFSQLFGKAWDGGSFMIAYEYDYHSSISGADRDWYTQDLTGIGKGDGREISCPSPTVTTLFGVNYAAPGYTPGTTNRCDQAKVADIYPKESRNSVFANFNMDITSRLKLDIEGYYTARRTETKVPMTQLNPFLMTAANPYFFDPSRTGQLAELVNWRLNSLYGSDTYKNTADLWSTGVVGTLTYDLGHDWRATGFINLGRSNTDVVSPNYNPVAFNAAVAATTPGAALDPFNGRTSAAVIKAITDYTVESEADQSLRDINLQADGPVFSLPAGEVKLAIGYQNHLETYKASQFNGPASNPTALNSHGRRTVNSVFGELFVPLVGEANALPLVRALDFSVAGRYDDYSDTGSTTNPKVALHWGLVDGFDLRATYGTSFHAPSLADKGSPTVDNRIQISGPQVIIAGGSPDLKPETSTNYSVGADFHPKFLPGFSANLTYYDVDFSNEIGLALTALPNFFTSKYYAQGLLNSPQVQAILSTAAGLPIVGGTLPPYAVVLDLRRYNFSEVDQDGLDFSARQFFNVGQGQLLLGLVGNYVLHQKVTGAPGAETTDNADNRVRLSLQGSAAWRQGPYSAGLRVNYTGGFTSTAVTPSSKVGSVTTTDIDLGYDLPAIGLMSGTHLQLNIDNLFDEDPVVYGFSSLGEPLPVYSGNPMGRAFRITVTKRW